MAKKDFKGIENPALTFISSTEPAPKKKATRGSKGKAPEGYKINPEYIEKKTKRVQLLLQPSIVDGIKELASKKGLSMNEAINEAINQYLEKEGK